MFDEFIEEEMEEPGKIVENIRAIAAIGTQIAIENVTIVHYALRVISRIVDSMTDNNEKWDILDKVIKKLSSRHNSTYDQIWLQDISYNKDKKCPYNVSLCRFVMGEDEPIWNNAWLKPELVKFFPLASICDAKRLETLSSYHIP